MWSKKSLQRKKTTLPQRGGTQTEASFFSFLLCSCHICHPCSKRNRAWRSEELQLTLDWPQDFWQKLMLVACDLLTEALRSITFWDPDAGKDWEQEEKETTEDEMVGWHHRLNGHEFKQAPGFGGRQGSLVCCSPWGCRKESDTT